MSNSRRDVIIACDFDSRAKLMDFVSQFGDRRPFLKIGMELFYAEGPDIVRELKTRGHRIFLDLKLHDIPNTVKKSMSVLAGLGADICNVHAAGTGRMMKAALEGLQDGAEAAGRERPLLIAVTQLTSTDQGTMESDILIDKPIDEVIISYAKNAKSSGLDGVVCSPLESPEIHKACGDDFLTVTPGIRFAEDAKGDQKRVTTPAMARELGSDFIVVGRSITKAADPVAAYERCRRDFI